MSATTRRQNMHNLHAENSQLRIARDAMILTNAELLGRIAEYEEMHRRVMNEECAPDEKHCACVPALRARIEMLEALVAEQAKTPCVRKDI